MTFSSDKHPRGKGGRFADVGNAPSMRTATVVTPPVRSQESASKVWRVGAQTPTIPAGYTGDTKKEHEAGTMLMHRFTPQIPPGMPVEDWAGLTRKLAHVARTLRTPSIDKALTEGIRVPTHKFSGPRYTTWRVPEGTARRSLVQAYGHATKLAMHKFGVVDYDFKMDQHLREEMTPLVPFIRYAMRRIQDGMYVDQGAHHPQFVEAFGKPFKDQRRDTRPGGTGEIRRRLRANDVLVKHITGHPLSQAEYDERSKAAKSRWADRHPYYSGVAATTGLAVGGGVVADAARYVRGRPERRDLNPKDYFSQKAGDTAHADRWRGGMGALEASGRQGRGGIAGFVGGSAGDAAIRHIDDLVDRRAGMQPEDKSKLRLWRGMGGAYAKRVFGNVKAGDHLTFDQHTSWTRDPSVASHYAGRDFTRGRAMGGVKGRRNTGRAGEALTEFAGQNLSDGEAKVRVHLRGAEHMRAADIDRTNSFPGPQQEVVVGRGTRIRVDKVREGKNGHKVVFATAVSQDAKAAYRRGILRRLGRPEFHAGRGAAGLTMGLSYGGLAAWATHGSLWGKKVEKLEKADGAPPEQGVLAPAPNLSRFDRYRAAIATREAAGLHDPKPLTFAQRFQRVRAARIYAHDRAAHAVMPRQGMPGSIAGTGLSHRVDQMRGALGMDGMKPGS